MSSARIVVMVPEFPKLSETFVVSRFVKLVALGFDVYIVCVRRRIDLWESFPQLRGKTKLKKRVRTSWPASSRLLAAVLVPFALVRAMGTRPVVAARYLWRAWPLLRFQSLKWLYLDLQLILLRPHLVHFEFGTLAVERIHLGRLLGCKLVASFRGSDINHGPLKHQDCYRRTWRELTAIHCLGLDLWSKVCEHGCPPGKAHVLIPPAVDTDYFQPPPARPRDIAGTAERPLRLLSVGRLEWKKGYEYAIQATALLRQRGLRCEYRLIGGGDHLEAMLFAVHDMGVHDDVSLLGPGGHETVRAQLAWADIFVHPSLSEGFCNAVVEAQAMGVPVVCSDAGGLRENVEDGITGIVIPRRSAEALVTALEYLARSPETRTRMGQNGRERVLAKHSLDKQAEAFGRWYSGILENEARLRKPPSRPKTDAIEVKQA